MSISGALPSQTPDSLTQQELWSAGLLFDRELQQGLTAPVRFMRAEVKDAVRTRAVPRAPARRMQQVAIKLRLLDCWRRAERVSLAAREAVLGAAAAAPPRFLVRVDEFPHYRAWDDAPSHGTAAFERFHELMVDAGVPYLIAALPRLSRNPLDPAAAGSRALTDEELGMLERMRDQGTAMALHGRDHRTRWRSPRRRSELCGLGPEQTSALIGEGMSVLAGIDVEPTVFVAPYNRFDAGQLPLLARRFDVVCGGPESVGLLGFHNTPQWRGEAVYLPSYPPFYGAAEQILPAAADAIARSTGLWTPIVLHWEWERREDWRNLRLLLDQIAPFAERWQDFAAAVERSRALTR